MFCRWSETLNFTQHEPSIKGNQSFSGKQHSPIILAISKIAIYFYTYVDHATVHSYAISQTNPSIEYIHMQLRYLPFLQNKGLLLYEISSRMGLCHNLHHRNPFTAS